MVKPSELGNPTVTYINRYGNPSPGPLDSIRGMVGGKKKYHVSSEAEPFQSFIPLNEIDGFQDQRIREVLWRQFQEGQEKAGMISIPVIFFANRALSHVIRVPTRPLNVRFTSRGIEEFPDD